MKQEDGRLLTVVEVSRWLGVISGTVYRLAAAELLPSVRVGHSLRFSGAEIEGWLQSETRGAVR